MGVSTGVIGPPIECVVDGRIGAGNRFAVEVERWKEQWRTERGGGFTGEERYEWAANVDQMGRSTGRVELEVAAVGLDRDVSTGQIGSQGAKAIE